MSKKKNRSVRTLPVHNVSPRFPSPNHEYYGNHSPYKQNHDSKCFGEPIRKTPEYNHGRLYSRKTTENVDSLANALNNLSFKSSSSSVSWNEDFETEYTRKIQKELEQIERALRSEDALPPYYDEEEFHEWMEKFPDLTIFGTSVNEDLREQTIHGSIENQDVLATNPNSETVFCDCSECTSISDSSQAFLKHSVIDTIYDNVTNRLFRRNPVKDNVQKTSMKSKHKPRNKRNTLSNVDIDNYLRVSPMPQRRYFDIVDDTDKRDNSSSLINSQVSSARWLKADSPEYTSLPFLPEDINLNSIFQHSGGESIKIKQKLKKSKEFLVLPPIDSPQVTHNPFRSVSAVPREQSKCLSAFSVKLHSDLSASRSQFDVFKYLSENSSVKIRASSRIPRIRKRWDSVAD